MYCLVSSVPVLLHLFLLCTPHTPHILLKNKVGHLLHEQFFLFPLRTFFLVNNARVTRAGLCFVLLCRVLLALILGVGFRRNGDLCFQVSGMKLMCHTMHKGTSVMHNRHEFSWELLWWQFLCHSPEILFLHALKVLVFVVTVLVEHSGD